MNIIFKNPDEIIPYKKNPRKNDGAIDAVANSIQEFGFRVPVIIDEAGVIVAGHTRVKAAKKLGLSKVPCLVADDLDDQQIKAFRLTDNKVSEIAQWDFLALGEELQQITKIDMEPFGFSDQEITDEDLEGLMADGVSASSKPVHRVTVNLSSQEETKNVADLLRQNGYDPVVKNT